MRVRVVDPDILSRTRVRDQIRRAGWALVGNDEPADAVVVNLARVDPASAIADSRVASPGATVVGFCGHADSGRRETAVAAGYDAVISHGEAMNRLAQAIAALTRKERKV
jgi:DNA-binding NarL/FixJ family response regulator